MLYRFVYDTYGELSDIKTDDGISLKNSEIVSEKTKDYTVEELTHAAGLTYLYNGQYGVATDQNGLYYMRARYYDQDIKRFINRDIVSGDIGNSKSLNRYAYVQGNPVSLTDPFGLCPDSNSSVRLIRTFLCDTDWSEELKALGATGSGNAGKGGSGTNAASRYGIDMDNLNFSNAVQNHTGRPYQDSKLLIHEIIESKPPIADSQGTSALYWEVEGSFNGSNGIYELLIDPESTTVWHFLFKKY